jgi:hypothetical protein
MQFIVLRCTNFLAADAFDGRTDTSCASCIPQNNTNSTRRAMMKKNLISSQPVLSKSAKEHALTIGRRMWNDKYPASLMVPRQQFLRKMALMNDNDDDNGAKSSPIVFQVFIEENGHLFEMTLPMNDLI